MELTTLQTRDMEYYVSYPYETNPQSLCFSHTKSYTAAVYPKLSGSADIELELIVVSSCDKALHSAIYSSVKKMKQRHIFNRKLSPHLIPVIK